MALPNSIKIARADDPLLQACQAAVKNGYTITSRTSGACELQVIGHPEHRMRYYYADSGRQLCGDVIFQNQTISHICAPVAGQPPLNPSGPPPPRVKVLNFDKLQSGQIIVAEKNTITKIVMPDGSSVQLSELSRFQIDKDSDTEVHGVFGRFRTLLLCHVDWGEHRQCPFSRFSTPTAVAAVRGTEFTVDANELRSIFRVFHGVLAVSDLARKNTVQVAANQETVVPKDGVPSDPRPFDPKAVDRWWELRSGFPYYGPVLGALSAFTLLIVLPQIWRRRKAHMPPPPAAPSATAHG
jgi:hypothetical protein